MFNSQLNSRFTEKEAHPYFIADIGANHDGSLSRALDLINLVAESGGHAAKFQHFEAKTLVSERGFRKLGRNLAHQAAWTKSVFEVYEDATIDLEWTNALVRECEKVNIDFFTSAYSQSLVDFIDPYVDVFKIGSGDITWTDLISHTASKGKPIILATGASTLEDITRAVQTVEILGNNLCIMQCNTNYSGSVENFKHINLRALLTFRKRFPQHTLGLSDHTPGHATVLGAQALGAVIFEKHFTDRNDRVGPDHGFAMNPASWAEMIARSTELHLALGHGAKIIEANELESVIVQRRALCAAKELKDGVIIKADDLDYLRPCPPNGIPPYDAEKLVGKRLVKPMRTGEHFTWQLVK